MRGGDRKNFAGTGILRGGRDVAMVIIINDGKGGYRVYFANLNIT